VGAWDVGVKQDDTVLDVIGDFEKIVKEGVEPSIASGKLLEKWSGADEDDRASVWLGLAEAQWQYGVITPDVIQRVEQIAAGEGQQLWREQGDKVYSRRLKRLDAFLAKIREPNPRPRKPKKPIIRRAKFSTGDCLAIRTDGDDYIAALVTGISERNPEYGQTIVLALDYWSKVPPSLEHFATATPLRLTFGHWNGVVHISHYGPQRFRAFRERITVVGHMEVPRRFRNLEVRMYSSWPHLVIAATMQHEFAK
jgi:hypothetical protein